MSVAGLRALRGAMEGIAASLLCTCDGEGQAQCLDDQSGALGR